MATIDATGAPTRRRRRWLRRLLWSVLAVVLLLAAVVGVGGVVLVRASFPTVEGTLRVSGLHGRVDVLRDDLGVPQVYASDAHDLFLAQGYVHAQDRFWEMDVRRHIASGRLSEMLGPDTVEFDAAIRTMGWYRVAEQELPLLAADTRAHLDAYAEGVNAYLAAHSGSGLSLEYALLGVVTPGYTPQPWTPADSVSWLKAMAWNLNESLLDQIRHALLPQTLSGAEVDSLFPTYDYGRWEPIVRDGDLPRPLAAAAARPAPVRAGAAFAAAASVLAPVDAVLGPRGKGIGSNSWVVAGNRTATGRPLLANDPHLGPSMPGVWYQIGLHCTASCRFDVAGYSFAGVPGVVIGHNADIAWGFTNLGPADSDLYLEKITGTTYEYQGAQVPLEVRTETITVSGGPAQNLTVRSTRHGPIVSDAFDDHRRIAEATGYAVAMRWTALEPHQTMDAVFALNLATDWASFRAATATFAVPAQNIIYADRAGHIGYQTPGLVPIRPPGDAARRPVAGWTGAHEWSGYLPFEALPSVLDPPRGYIVTANNAVVGPSYPHMITSNWGDGYRAKRITDLLEAAGTVSVAEMQSIQADTYNANAAFVVPYLLDVAADPAAVRAQDLLRGWDFAQPADSAPAAYFNAVWRHLLRLTFGDELTGNLADLAPDGGGQWWDVVRALLTRPDDPWWSDGADLVTRDDVLRAALSAAALELSASLGSDPAGWRWGSLHQLTLRNGTLGEGGPGLVKWLLNRGPFDLGGGPAAVNALGWDAAEGYEVSWVPSMRMVVDLSDLDASRWINLTGASGHAFATHYADQAELWARGETVPWRFGRDAVDRATAHRLALVP